MVATRSSAAGASRDDNRMIAIVTGANSGYGLGICQQLLDNLSLPLGDPIPASQPQASALSSSQRHLLSSPASPSSSSSAQLPSDKKHVPAAAPPTLTLIFACRSQAKAEEAMRLAMEGHERVLRKRLEKGVAVREGWKEGLRLVWEGVDLDEVGGKTGLLAFCGRIKATYPHLTSLFLNAGVMGGTGNNYLQFAWQVVTDGLVQTCAHPTYNIQAKGLKSRDGERGMVWGVNCLAPYILAKELAPLLRKSPSTLPFPPRIVYTSSLTALYAAQSADPLADPQCLNHEHAYEASKYMGDLVMLQLDRELNPPSSKERHVRCLIAEPGAVATKIFDSFGPWKWWSDFMHFLYWLAFYICRLCGSPYHPVYATEGALVMLYAALVDEKYLQPPSKVPGQKFSVHASRWGKTTVDYGEVDRWEESLATGEGLVKVCEGIRLDWRRREGLE